jgi:YihY family inner membrane protein
VGALLRRLDGWQRSRQWLGFPFAVLKKFSEDSAGNLAALIAYYTFFSIFPLLVVFATVLGFVFGGNPSLEHGVMATALKQFPIVGSHTFTGLHGSVLALVIGLVLATWSGLGAAKMAQTAFNSVYLVPRDERPNFLKSTGRAACIVVVGGIGLIATTAVTGAVTDVRSIAGWHVGIGLKVLGTALAALLDAALFLVLFRWLTVRRVGWRDAWPGALLSASVLAGLQLAVGAITTHKLKGAQPTYGNLAAVIVLLSWFYLQAQVVLLGAEINVVRQYRLWPRAMTDPPATADLVAYEAYAEEYAQEPATGKVAGSRRSR